MLATIIDGRRRNPSPPLLVLVPAVALRILGLPTNGTTLLGRNRALLIGENCCPGIADFVSKKRDSGQQVETEIRSTGSMYVRLVGKPFLVLFCI